MTSQQDADLKKLAKDILAGDVFTSVQIRDPSLLPNIFLPIALGALSADDIENFGLAYEYMNNACPMGINGYPCFMSCRLLNKADAQKLVEMVQLGQAAIDSALD